jgi:DNA-binding transcriptional ArsR family regulator
LSQLLAERSSPAKGWVRDGILSFLAKRRGTASEIAVALGVSKATVSYHTKALIRRDVIEIADIRSIRGGVYSKTYALKQTGLTLSQRKADQSESLTKADEQFEKLLLAMHLEPKLKPAEELQIFLYHLFRLLAESGSLDDAIFEDYGRRIGNGLVASSLDFKSFRDGLKELADNLRTDGIADVTAQVKKGGEPRLVCMGCLGNKEYGSLVCSFTRGVMTGAIKAKDGATLRLERVTRGSRAPGCTYVVRKRGFKR